MKNFKDFLAEKMKEINVADGLDIDEPIRIKLTEADDDEDPFADESAPRDPVQPCPSRRRCKRNSWHSIFRNFRWFCAPPGSSSD